MAFHRLFGRGTSAAPPLLIERTPLEERAAALSSALGTQITSAPAFERRARAGGMDLTLLWSLRTPSPAVPGAAALIIPHPGRTGLVLVTAPQHAEHARVVGAVLRFGLAQLQGSDHLHLVQALVDPDDALRAAALTEGGMRLIATLLYLERPITPATTPAAPALHHGERIERWNPQDRAMLGALLRRTYEQTLDCPGLADMRENEDIVDGHLSSGEHDPALWFILRRGEEALGALLLAPSRATESIELVYLGLTIEARQRGLGSALLHHGMRAVAARPERVLALAVDARNTPAAQLYARNGFVQVRRRDAWIAGIARAALVTNDAAPVK